MPKSAAKNAQTATLAEMHPLSQVHARARGEMPANFDAVTAIGEEPAPKRARIAEQVAPASVCGDAINMGAVNTKALVLPDGIDAGAGEDENGDEGLIRRAACWRLMYNPEKKKQYITPFLLGFHMENRDSIAINGDRCEALLKQICHDGFDYDEANRDNFAIEPSGPKDPSIQYNIDVCGHCEKLATLRLDWKPIGLTVAHSHLNQALKNIYSATPSSVPGIVDANGNISIDLVGRKDDLLAKTCRTGLEWQLFPQKMIEERPNALHDISQAANVKNGNLMLETEMQAIARLASFCKAETNAAGRCCYKTVRRKMALSMPAVANAQHFKETFSLVITLGGGHTKWVNSLVEFYGLWVDPTIRKVRYATLNSMGVWPLKLREETTTPLVVAMIKATYAADREKYMKDDYMEFVTARDMKLDENDKEQKERFDTALKGLKYFQNDWQPALNKECRGDRIQQLAISEISIAKAYLQKDAKFDIR